MSSTAEQQRGAILSNRLQILNDFLVSKKGTPVSFGDYLKTQAMDEKSFYSEMPKNLVRNGISKATSNDVAFVDYIHAVNDEYMKQYLNFREIKHDEDLDRAIGRVGVGVMGASEYAADGDFHNASATAITVCNLRYPPPRFGKRVDSYQACLVEETKKSEAKKEVRQEKREDKKEAKAEAKNSCQVGYRWSVLLKKCVKDGSTLNAVNKFNPIFVAMRSSFRSMVALNLFGIASALKMLKSQSPAKWKLFLTKWFLFGGEESKLNQSIDNGSRKKMFPKAKTKVGADGIIEYSWSSADGDEEKSLAVSDSQTEEPPKDYAALAKTAAKGLAAGTATLAVIPGAQPAAVWVGSATAIVAVLIPILNSFAKEKGVPASDLPATPPLVGVDEETKEALTTADAGEDTGAPRTGGFSDWLSTYKWWLIGALGLTGIITTIAIMSGKKKG